jgi:isoquinoline 1-oxidoreductase alpha subunit
VTIAAPLNERRRKKRRFDKGGPRHALLIARQGAIACEHVRERTSGFESSRRNAVANLRVNGQERSYDGDPSMPLLWYLRDELGLTGTKFGCGAALCGNCTVHVDGAAVRSCVTPMSELTGKSVTTIEGLSPKGDHPVQVAWREQGVPQCGYCQTGQIMQAAAFLAKTPGPTDAQISEAMAGNLCRCGCYQRIHSAVRAAARGA